MTSRSPVFYDRQSASLKYWDTDGGFGGPTAVTISTGGGAPDAHKTSHQDGGSDELDLTGLSGGFQNPYPLVAGFLEDIEMRDGKTLWFDTAKTTGLSYNQGSIAYVFEVSGAPEVYLAGVSGIALQGNVGVDGSGTFSNYIMLDDEGRQIYSAKYTDLVENPSELELYQWLFGGSMLVGADLLLGKGANVFNRPNLVGNGLGPWVMDQYATVWIEGAPAVFDDFSITAPAAMRVAAGLVALAPGTTSYAPLNIPAGVAKTSPADGDIWIDAAGDIFLRRAGVSKQFMFV